MESSLKSVTFVQLCHLSFVALSAVSALLGNSMDAVCQVAHVPRRHSCHRNPSILGHVHGKLLRQALDLQKKTTQGCHRMSNKDMCNWSIRVCTCSGFRPVKQNIPIWSMTCCQLWVEPSFFRPATSCSLILMMRLAMPCTSSSLLIERNRFQNTPWDQSGKSRGYSSSYHSERSSGVLRIVAAILAPFIGGLE